jgi:hypothetical protein
VERKGAQWCERKNKEEIRRGIWARNGRLNKMTVDGRNCDRQEGKGRETRVENRKKFI